MKKKRRTQQNEITSISNQEAPNQSIDISHYAICDFVPKGKTKAKEVHFLLYPKNSIIPISLRFTSPHTLADLITELDSARTRVFFKRNLEANTVRDEHVADEIEN